VGLLARSALRTLSSLRHADRFPRFL